MSFARRILALFGHRRSDTQTSSPDGSITARNEQSLARMLDAYSVPSDVGASLQESMRLNTQAGILLRDEKWDEALKLAERAHLLYPLGWAALGNKATALMMLGRDEEALEAYQLAASRNPADVSISVAMGTVLVNLGRYEEGMKAFDEALDTSPTGPMAARAFLGKAKAYEKTSRTTEAVRYYRRALESLPPDARAGSGAHIRAKMESLARKRD